MEWHYSEAEYRPGRLPGNPYMVIARGNIGGAVYSEINAYGETPEQARERAERGAAQLDNQKHLFPWKAAK